MSKIYQTLYSEIETILQSVENVGEIVTFPTANFSKYPAVVFFPSEVSNIFSTSSDNFREYKFKMFVVVGVNQTTMENVFKNVLSNTCDAVLEAFDKNWKLTSLDGHRVWIRIDSGTWGVEKDEKGLMAVAELSLIIKLSVNN
jgi:hypothetical protein